MTRRKRLVVETFTPPLDEEDLENLAVISFAEQVVAFEDGKIRKRLEAMGAADIAYLGSNLSEDKFPSVAEAAAEVNEMLDMFEKMRADG